MIKNFSERYAALLILAALLFNPPVVSIFNSAQLVLGVPILFLYLFLAWALIIALNAYLAKKLALAKEVAREAAGDLPDVGSDAGAAPKEVADA